MAIYWHPLLAQFLKEDYGDRLEIKDSVKIGKMPLELDILITPSVPTEELPYPFNYLGGTTIAELKGPGGTATHREITQVEIYGCLYQNRKAKKAKRVSCSVSRTTQHVSRFTFHSIPITLKNCLSK